MKNQRPSHFQIGEQSGAKPLAFRLTHRTKSSAIDCQMKALDPVLNAESAEHRVTIPPQRVVPAQTNSGRTTDGPLHFQWKKQVGKIRYRSSPPGFAEAQRTAVNGKVGQIRTVGMPNKWSAGLGRPDQTCTMCMQNITLRQFALKT